MNTVNLSLYSIVYIIYSKYQPQLVENLEALIKAFKGRLIKATIVASMSPGVKVEWEE